MKLTVNKIDKKSKDFKEAKKLLKKSYAKDELYPFWIMNFMVKKGRAEFLGFYEEDRFIGATFTTSSNKGILIWYLAVNEELRHKGYGSKIISSFKTLFKNINIYAHVPLVEDYKKYQNEIEILEKFYSKNGFYNTKYKIENDGDQHIVYSTRIFNKDEYISLAKLLSFGVFKPKIEKIDK